MSETLRQGESLRKGWCPGALSPMLSGDGYLVRLRLTNGVLLFERAHALANLARRFGNGLFDLSARANLQMRGVGADSLAPLQAELAALGLLDSDPRAEAVRNVTPSPLAGFDSTAVLDAGPLVEALEHLLTREATLHDLPPKFGFSVDGGGRLPLQGVEADIGFCALASSEGPRLEVKLGGVTVGSIEPNALCAVAETLARNFIRLRGPDRRMAALVARIGASALLEGLDLAVIARSFRDEAIEKSQAGSGLLRSARNDAAEIGAKNILGAQNCGDGAFVGAGLLFGRIDADALQAFAKEAQSLGGAELRLTPWRAILSVGLTTPNAEKLAGRAAALGFLLDADDARLVFAACPGAPACSSAYADVRGLALRLAVHWSAAAGRVHVSGCAKGCAYPAPALTIVAGKDGFALVENGRAGDEPLEQRLDVAALEQNLKRYRQKQHRPGVFA